MTTREPQRLADILAALKTTTQLGAHLDHAQIWQRWEELAGPEFGPRSHPLKVRKGVLTVAVVSPVWMHKLSYDKHVILDKINRLLSKECIEDIYLTLPAAEDLPPPNPPSE